MNSTPPAQKKRRLTRYLWLFLTVACVGLGWAGLNIFYRFHHPQAPSELAKEFAVATKRDPASITKHVRVNGVDYDVPVGYFRRRVPYYTEDLDIYLIAMLPDFKMIGMSEQDVFYHGKQRETVVVLAHNAPRMISIEAMAKFYKEFSHRKIYAGKKFDLEYYDGKDFGYGEPYIYRVDGKVVSVIYCGDDFTIIDGKTRKDQPLCSAFFTDGILMYDVGYDKKFLKDWKSIEDKTRKMFIGFQENAKNKNLDQVKILPERVDPMAREWREQHPNPQPGDRQ